MIAKKIEIIKRATSTLSRWEKKATYYARRAAMTDADLASERERRERQKQERETKLKRGISLED
jgi:hypothetical protein|tara:strand:- start:7876 stop:8067 length:192 start_codon:yes stop_codon:yes gene_type:complete